MPTDSGRALMAATMANPNTSESTRRLLAGILARPDMENDPELVMPTQEKSTIRHPHSPPVFLPLVASALASRS